MRPTHLLTMALRIGAVIIVVNALDKLPLLLKNIGSDQANKLIIHVKALKVKP